MSQYVIDIKNGKQADALIRYLKSLDYVEVKPLPTDPKSKAVSAARDFLSGLPDGNAKQADVNQAVGSIRIKNGYR